MSGTENLRLSRETGLVVVSRLIEGMERRLPEAAPVSEG